jgi:hypothetical protein
MNNDNGVRVINFSMNRSIIVENTTFQHYDIHKCTQTSVDGKSHSEIVHVLIGRENMFLMFILSGEQTVLVTVIWQQENLGIGWA